MDWKLAKSLFIASFLLMNIVLIYIFYNESNAEVSQLAESTNALESTNIDTSALDNFESISMNIIIGKPLYFDMDLEEDDSLDQAGNTLTTMLEDSLQFDTDTLSTYKNNSIYRGEEYHYDEVMSEDGLKIFNQYYQDYPIFSHDAARLYFSEEQNSVTQGYIENIEQNDYSTEQKVRHPKKIVENLYTENNITDNAAIESATLGYYIILEETDQVMMRPKWQFEIIDEDVSRIIYVDALSQTEDIIERE